MSIRGCVLVALVTFAVPASASAATNVDTLVTRLAALTELTYDGWKAGPDIAKAHLEGDLPARPDFDDTAWSNLSIGESIYPDSCWLRKTIVLPKTYLGRPVAGSARFKVSVDDAGTLFVNGESKGYFAWNGDFELTGSATPGHTFAIAIKAINTGGPLRLLRAQVELTGTQEGERELRQKTQDLALSLRVGQKLLGFDTYQTSARKRSTPGSIAHRMRATRKKNSWLTSSISRRRWTRTPSSGGTSQGLRPRSRRFARSLRRSARSRSGSRCTSTPMRTSTPRGSGASAKPCRCAATRSRP
jgi:hypothetical protein